MVMITPDGRRVDPQWEALPSGSVLVRVHSSKYAAADYNPGPDPAMVDTRFAFFGSPTVPVLYAASTEDAAIAEVILHDVPVSGGRIDETLVRQKVMSQVVSTRDMRLLALHGDGFRQVGTEAEAITRTSPSRYFETVPWAAAAHAAGFDGIVWMSRRHDSAKSYVLFGTRGKPGDFTAGPGVGRAFSFEKDLDWLTRKLLPLNIMITAS